MRFWILCWFLHAGTVIYVPTQAYSALWCGGHSIGDSRIEVTESEEPGLHVTYVCPHGPFMNTYIEAKAKVAAEIAYYYLWALASEGKINAGEFFSAKGINVDFFPNNPNAVFNSWAVCMAMLSLVTGKKIKGKYAFMGEIWANQVMTYDLDMSVDMIQYALKEYDKVYVSSSRSDINPELLNVPTLYELKDIFDENPFTDKSSSVKSVSITGVSPVMEDGDLHDIEVWAVPGTGEIKFIGHMDPTVIDDIKKSLELLLTPDEIDKMKAKDIVVRFPDPIFGPSFGLAICIGIVGLVRGKQVKRYVFTGLCPNVCWHLAANTVNKARAATKLGTFVMMGTDYALYKDKIDQLRLEIIQWPFFYTQEDSNPSSIDREYNDTERRAEYLRAVNLALDKLLVDKHDKDENKKFYEVIEEGDPLSIYKYFSANPWAKVFYWFYTLTLFPIAWVINHITYCIGTVLRLAGFRSWRNLINFSAEQISFFLLKLVCFGIRLPAIIAWFPLREILFCMLNLFLNTVPLSIIWFICIFVGPFMNNSCEFVNRCTETMRSFSNNWYNKSRIVDRYLIQPIEFALIDLITGIKYADRKLEMQLRFDL